MGRKAKCQICKKELNTDVAFKITKDNKNKYCCTEQEYKEYIQNLTKKNELFNYWKINILNYEEDMELSPYFQKRLKQISTTYSYEIVLETSKHCKNSIEYALNNVKFNDENHMINYMMNIIKNNINSVYAEWKQLQKIKQENDNKIDIDLSNMEFINDTRSIKQEFKNDISQFLED